MGRGCDDDSANGVTQGLKQEVPSCPSELHAVLFVCALCLSCSTKARMVSHLFIAMYSAPPIADHIAVLSSSQWLTERVPSSQSSTVSQGTGIRTPCWALEKYLWRTIIEVEDTAHPKHPCHWFAKASCLFLFESPRNSVEQRAGEAQGSSQRASCKGAGSKTHSFQGSFHFIVNLMKSCLDSKTEIVFRKICLFQHR